jgi:hypothetical protein
MGFQHAYPGISQHAASHCLVANRTYTLCTGCAACCACAALTTATLKSKACVRSEKLMPMKAWRLEEGSSRRSTKLRLLSTACTTTTLTMPGGMGHTPNTSPLQTGQGIRGQGEGWRLG